MTRKDQKMFSNTFPLTDKAVAVMEGHLNKIKNEIKPLVAPLFRSNAFDSSVEYLTSVRIEDKDLPWNMPKELNPSDFPDPREQTHPEDQDYFDKEIAKEKPILGLGDVIAPPPPRRRRRRWQSSDSSVQGAEDAQAGSKPGKSPTPEGASVVEEVNRAAEVHEEDNNEDSSGDEPLVKERKKLKKSPEAGQHQQVKESSTESVIHLHTHPAPKSKGAAVENRHNKKP